MTRCGQEIERLIRVMMKYFSEPLPKTAFLVTLDKDFGELVIVRGHFHSGIIRLVNFPAKHQASVCALILDLHGKELERGAMITAEPGRLRVRPADKGI